MVDLGAYKDKFGDSGQRVLENALSESRRRDQNFIAVEHIIFALAKEEPDLFNSTIRSLAIDPEQPDLRRFPRFRGLTALGGGVEPGETLFIPRGWWHHTRTLEAAVSMNFWWGGPFVQLTSLASTLFKRARRIRRDEWAE